MKISGSYTMQAARQAVWDKLIDPDAIAGCLPGVEELTKVGDNEFTMAMTVGIGPVRGTYAGKVTLANLNPPESYEMQVEGSGRPGFVKGSGQIHLAQGVGGGTAITYEGDVEVGGPVGSVAQRMLGGVARRMIEQFFGCIEKQITGG
ncbi:MAG: carbon monoxide dehydrogenase subunit G [Sphaerobacter sp.]|nr:carbon monoxide dehydrogenase subunit G [Sphaerobacter sp.]